MATRKYAYPMTAHANSFKAIDALRAGDRTYEYFRLSAVEQAGLTKLARLPYSLKILLENLLRFEDGRSVTKADIEALSARWSATARHEKEIAFRPARVLLQDFTGVPCVVDLAAMRDAMAAMGGDPKAINPLQPVELSRIEPLVPSITSDQTPRWRRMPTSNSSAIHERYAFLQMGAICCCMRLPVPFRLDTGIVPSGEHRVSRSRRFPEYLMRAWNWCRWRIPILHGSGPIRIRR